VILLLFLLASGVVMVIQDMHHVVTNKFIGL
jgi:hypothetical protein